MRLFIAYSIASFFILSSSPASAQACVSQMSANMQQMAQNALQCGESAAAMGSLTRTGSISGAISPERLEGMCNSGRDMNGQLAAFNQCSRVYVCAVAAYVYAIRNISSFGGDCQAAAQEGLRRFPVK